MNKYNVKDDYREIKMREMMKLYDPKWMAWVGLFASLVHAFSLPMFGFCLSQYIFILALPVDDAADKQYFNDQRNYWASIFLGVVIGIGLSAFI